MSGDRMERLGNELEALLRSLIGDSDEDAKPEKRQSSASDGSSFGAPARPLEDENRQFEGDGGTVYDSDGVRLYGRYDVFPDPPYANGPSSPSRSSKTPPSPLPGPPSSPRRIFDHQPRPQAGGMKKLQGLLATLHSATSGIDMIANQAANNRSQDKTCHIIEAALAAIRDTAQTVHPKVYRKVIENINIALDDTDSDNDTEESE